MKRICLLLGVLLLTGGSLDNETLNTPGTLSGGVLSSGALMPPGGAAANTLFEAIFSQADALGELPACTATNDCLMQCTAESDADWACVDGSGTPYTVTQGSGTTADTSPMKAARYYLEDLTDTSCPTLTVSGVTALEDVWNAPHTVVMTGYSSGRTNATYQYSFEQDTQLAHYIRHEGNFRPHWVAPLGTTIPTISNNQYKDGWNLWATRKQGMASTGTATYQGYISGTFGAAINRSGAGWDPATGASGRWEFGCRVTGGLPLRGGLESFTLYDVAKTDAEIEEIDGRWRGIWHGGIKVDFDYTNVQHWTEDANGTDLQAQWGALPSVEAAGLYLDAREAQAWAADSRDASSWTAVGTPIITVDNVAGVFAKFETTNQADTIEDNDGAAAEGVQSDDITSITNGWYTASCYLQQGTETDARLSVLTDGTGSTTCTHALTAGMVRYSCSADVGGTPTYVRSQLLVGDADADTGTIVVNHCQLEDGSWPSRVKLNKSLNGQVAKHFNAADAATWGVDLNAAGSVEVVFSLLRDMPDGDGANPFYLFDWGNAGNTNHKFVFWKYDDTRELAMRITNTTCTAGGTDETFASSGTLNYTAGNYYVAKAKWSDEGATLKHEIYLDACADPTTCTATTLRGSNTGRCKPNETNGDFHIGQRFSGGSLGGHIYRVTIKDQ